uniref:TRASH domain-containing protein n=1 Tax=viral metagenome TaxID=1070528 RepID=A0A6C0KDY2_9ZZZZ
MSLIPDLKLKPLEEIIGDKKEEKKQEEGRAILPARCENCGKIYYVREGRESYEYEKGKPLGFCSGECRGMFDLDPLNSYTYQMINDDDSSDDEMDQVKMDENDAAITGGMRGGATEITDNTLEKKLIDATAPYNEKAARNAQNFAKASIEVGKAILDQLKLDPVAFINKAKNLGIKITEITKEGIFLLFPGDNSMGESVDKLIMSGSKLYFLPVRILGTIAITIFLSMFDVFIPLKFLEKIHGLKPFIDLIMKYSSIVPTILKNLKIPNLSLGSLIDSDVMDASFLRKGSKYEYKPTRNTDGGRKKKRKTRRKKRRKN